MSSGFSAQKDNFASSIQHMSSSEEKENISRLQVPAHVDAYNQTRSPLQNVNSVQSPKLNPKVTMYSQVTPCTTPLTKTPASRIRSLVDESDGQSKEPQIALNALIYKKVMDIVDSERENYERLLQEKDERISILLKQNRRLQDADQDSVSNTDSSEESMDRFAEKFVRNIINNVLGSFHIMETGLNDMPKSTEDSVKFNSTTGLEVKCTETNTDSPSSNTDYSDKPMSLMHRSGTPSDDSVSPDPGLTSQLVINELNVSTLNDLSNSISMEVQTPHRNVRNKSTERLLKEIKWVDSATSPIKIFTSMSERKNSSMITDEELVKNSCVLSQIDTADNCSQTDQSQSSFENSPLRTCTENCHDIEEKSKSVAEGQETSSLTEQHSDQGVREVDKEKQQKKGPSQKVESEAVSDGTRPQMEADISRITEELQQQINQFKQENQGLQQDLLKAYRLHQNEIEELHQHYKLLDYKPHYERAQRIVIETQEELQLYKGLVHQVELTADIQAKLHERFMEGEEKLNIWSKRMEEEREQHKSIQEKLNLSEEKAKCAIEENQETKVKHIQMSQVITDAVKKIYQACGFSNPVPFELSNTSSYINNVTSHIEQSNEVKTKTEQLLKMAETDIETLRSREQKAFLESAVSDAVIEATQNDIAREQSISENCREQMQCMIENLQKECSNLQGENTALSSDLSQLKIKLNESQETSAHMDKHNKILEQEIQNYKQQITSSCRNMELVNSLNENLKIVQAQALENQEFLEEERAILEDGLKETEEKLKNSEMEMARYKASLLQQSKQCSEQKIVIEELSENLQVTEAELDRTKAQAQYLLMNQMEEMRAADAVTERLRERMVQLLDQLDTKTRSISPPQDKEELPKDEDPSSENVDEEKTNQPVNEKSNSLESNSLVSTILQAHQEGLTQNEDTERRESQIGSASSAFTRVADISKSVNDHDEQVETGTDLCEEDTSSIKKEQLIPLADQLTDLGVFLSKIIGLMTRLEDQISSKFTTMKDKNALLKVEMKKREKQIHEQLSTLEYQLKSSRTNEARLNADLQNRTSQHNADKKALRHAMDKLRELSESLETMSDQHCELQTQEKDIRHLRSSLMEKTHQCSLLEEELKLAGSQPGGSTSLFDVHLVRKENYKLKQQLLEKKEQMEMMTEKAKKRLAVYESNWHKADAEVTRLDSMIEGIKMDLESRYEELKGYEVIRSILTDLRSTQAVNSPKMLWNKTLRRVKNDFV